MVGSSMSREERRVWKLALRGGFVLLIAGSAALIAVQGGASLLEIVGIALFGGAFGSFLLWYLAWIGW